jgi:hypothetical protein
MPDTRPQGADADFDRMIVGEPGLQLERDIGFLRHLSAQGDYPKYGTPYPAASDYSNRL